MLPPSHPYCAPSVEITSTTKFGLHILKTATLPKNLFPRGQQSRFLRRFHLLDDEECHFEPSHQIISILLPAATSYHLHITTADKPATLPLSIPKRSQHILYPFFFFCTYQKSSIHLSSPFVNKLI